MSIFLAAFPALIVGILWLFFEYRYRYWSKLKVPHSKTCFPFGSLERFFKQNPAITIRRLYKELKHEPYFGIWFFYKPSLVLNDPDLIKDVLVTNFTNFSDRGIYINKKLDPLFGELCPFHTPVLLIATYSSSSTFSKHSYCPA